MPTAAPLFERVLLTNDDGIDAPGLAVVAGKISVTPLRFERTHAEVLAQIWAAAT